MNEYLNAHEHTFCRVAQAAFCIAATGVLAACHEQTINATRKDSVASPTTTRAMSDASDGFSQGDIETVAADNRNNGSQAKDDGADLAAMTWVEDERDRWLYVRRIRGSAKGAWATGSFDRTRNKIDIHTHDVDAFAIQSGRIPINWNRPVVLGIDGSNSELKRREQSMIYFEIDAYGAWVVREK